MNYRLSKIKGMEFGIDVFYWVYLPLLNIRYFTVETTPKWNSIAVTVKLTKIPHKIR